MQFLYEIALFCLDEFFVVFFFRLDKDGKLSYSFLIHLRNDNKYVVVTEVIAYGGSASSISIAQPPIVEYSHAKSSGFTMSISSKKSSIFISPTTS